MKVSKNFDIREFVPKIIWDNYQENSIWFVDPRIIAIAQNVRDYFSAEMTINDWHYGGTFQNRGYRTPASKIGAHYSQHKFGRAIDFNIKGLTAKECYKIIQVNHDWFHLRGVKAMEDIRDTPTWIHLDCRNTLLNHILIVRG